MKFDALKAGDMKAPGSTPANPLTIAYVAIGAIEAIRRQPGSALSHQDADRYGGQLGFIDAIISHAWRLDAEANCLVQQGNALSGVFVYEVAEPFGERYAQALISDPSVQPDAIVRDLFKEMLADEDCQK